MVKIVKKELFFKTNGEEVSSTVMNVEVGKKSVIEH